MGLLQRIRAAARAFQVPAPLAGEAMAADPFRLFPGSEALSPSALVRRQGLQVFDKIRRDEQAKAALTFKKLAVMSPGWRICRPGGAPEDWAPAVDLENDLDRLPGTFQQRLLGIMSALDYGFSVTEKLFEERDGRIALSGMKTRRASTVRLDLDAHGNLLSVRQVGFGTEVNVPPEKLVVFSWMPDWGDPHGTSDLESAFRSWSLKNHAFNWLAILLERYGIPPIFGLYDPNAFTPKQVDALKTVLTNLQAATSGVIPRTNKDNFELWSPELAGQVSRVFIPAFEMFDNQIARAILMPGLLGMTPDKLGSFARSRTVFDVFMFVVEHLQQELAEALNEQIVRPLTDLNHGPQDEYPVFEWLPLLEDNRNELFKTWAELVSKNVVRSGPEDEAHIRANLEFPDRTEEPEDEAVAGTEGISEVGLNGAQVKAALELLVQVAQGTLPADSARELLIGIGLTLEAVNRMLTALKRSGVVPEAPTPEEGADALVDLAQRTPSAAERRVDFAQVTRDLDALEMDAKIAIRTVLMEAFKRIERATKGDVAKIPTARLIDKKAMEEAVGTWLNATWRDGRRSARTELKGAKEMRDAISFAPSSMAAAWLLAKTKNVTGVLSTRLEFEIRDSIITSAKLGEGTAEAMTRVRGKIEPYVGDPRVVDPRKAGALETAHRLETIVRTNTTDLWNQGRIAEFRDPSFDGVIDWVEYSAIIDSRTTEICQRLDGKVFRRDDPNLDRLVPPNHFNCRSVLVPVTPDVEAELREQEITPSEVGEALELAGRGFAAP